MTQTNDSNLWAAWLDLAFYNNTLKQYAVALFSLLGLVAIFWLVKKLLVGRMRRWAEKTVTDFDDFVVGLFAQIGALEFITIALYFVTLPLHLGKSVRLALHYAVIVVLTVRAVLIVQQIVRYFIGKSYRRVRPNDPSARTMVQNITNILSAAVWALGLVFVLDNLGINISALVAGLGIGGIAVAMASQTVLGDLFSAVSIFVDKPFETGDFITIDDFLGTVEYVGLKTTRIRSLDGEELIFSNSDLTKSRIKNYKRMRERRVSFRFGVSYETPSEKLKKIPSMVKAILERAQNIRIDRVHFFSYGDFSLLFEVVYFVLSPDYNIYMDRQQEINLSIKEEFEHEGIEFAYSTQAFYAARAGAGEPRYGPN